jgi:hypothetical protein
MKDFIPLRSSKMRQVSCSPLMAMCSHTFGDTRDSILLNRLCFQSPSHRPCPLSPAILDQAHANENMSFEA